MMRVRTGLARSVPLLVAAIAAWLTLGVVSPLGSAPTARIGVLPPAWIGVALLLLAIVMAVVLRCRPMRLRPLYLSLVIWLPWLPLPIPAAFLLWNGPLAWAAWAVIAGLLAAPAALAGWNRMLAASPAVQTFAAVMIAVAAYTAAAWRMAPALPGGDEPHYLVITQSLLYDGDLRIENNHRRGDYRAYIEQDIKPDYLRRGRDHEIYSVHAPGVSVLVLPAFAAAGYPGAVVCLALVSALGGALVWRAAWRITGDAAAAWVGWATVALTAPFLFQAFTVFPDGPAAVLVMTGVYALAFPEPLLTRPSRALWHGAALAVLPWMHTRYVVLACTIGVLLLMRLARSPARDGSSRSLAGRAAACAAFLLLPVLGALAWFGFFYVIYGTFNPAAPYGDYTQTALGNVPRGLAGLLVDQQFGLLPNAPVYGMALAGVPTLWRGYRRLAVELLLIAAPYAVAVACYHMWWGGRSSPVRFLVPMLLPFGVAAAARWGRASLRARAVFTALLAASIGLAAALVWVDRGGLAYNVRDGFALWMDWVAPLVNVPRAVPTMFRNSRTVTVWLVAAWAIASAAGWLASRLFRGDPGPALDAMRGWVAVAIATTAGTTLGWHLAGAAPVEAGTGLLRVTQAVAGRDSAITLPLLHRVSAAEGLAHARIPTSLRRDRRADGVLFVARGLPAGRYRVTAWGRAPLSGVLEARVGRRVDPFLRTRLVDQQPGTTPLLLDLPAGAQVVTIDGDETARRSVEEVQLEIESFDARAGGVFARRVMRYGAATVWFVDDGAFAEPEGWWVRGHASAAVVIEEAVSRESLALLVRNGGAANRVTLRAGEWTAALALAPGEERLVDVPLANARTVLSVISEAGFKPVTADSASRDTRLLGVWLQIR